MNSFNVLSRDVNIHKSYLLEASAGTGKTFSIENIVCRLLIEDDFSPCKTLDQILVVTFTRASARDLKLRIRSALENTLAALNGNTIPPDYLQAIIEKGSEKIELTKRRLKQALSTFDQAQIYTIHSFCLRMLTTFLFESDIHMPSGEQERNLTKEEIFLLIRDFFRTKMRHDDYSPVQLQIVLNFHGNHFEKFQNALWEIIKKDCIISATPTFSEDFHDFKRIMQHLKTEKGLNAEKLRSDYEQQLDCYKVKKNMESIPPFIELFDRSEWSSEDFDSLIREGLIICEFLAPENAKKNKKSPQPSALYYPEILSILHEALVPLIDRARSYECIITRMAQSCGLLLRNFLEKEEKYNENDILKQMGKALQNHAFTAKVRNLYKTALIDEFQDTDPLQWEIFQKIFLHSKFYPDVMDNHQCPIYLVGDPKQSIYAFRQADIYTYLAAAKSLGTEHYASLDTNYRSQPSLIKGFNTLFQACPQIFSLPGLPHEQTLEYIQVKASSHACNQTFNDAFQSIHFFIAQEASKENKNFPSESCEENYYYPFITQEILRLHRSDKLKFNQFAVLIKDRFQAQRLAVFFKKYNIPYSLQKQSSVTESTAWESLKELLQAVLQPKNESAVKIALGGQILQWNCHEVKTLEDEQIHEHILAQFYKLKNKLHEGFALFFSYLLQTSWHADAIPIAERLLQQEEGIIFYDDLNQIACLIIEHQSQHPSTPEHLISFMDTCKKMSLEDEEVLKKWIDPSLEAVSILTMHNSKGLEYDVVFALGTVNRTKIPSKLIPKKGDSERYLIPCLDENSDFYLNYCEELDAEKMRQLYVAMTRAKYRLYLPVLVDIKGKSPKYGIASPMELFLARLGNGPCSYHELYRRIEQNNEERLNQFIMNHPEAHLSSTLLNDSIFSLEKIHTREPVYLIPPESVQISGEKCFIHSFTSLSKLKKNLQVNDEKSFPPHDYNCMNKTSHTLPAGTTTGKLLHKILETIPFSATENITCSKELSPWIEPLIEKTEFHSWKDILCDLTYQTLYTHLENGFSLKQIDPLYIYRETEFLYPCEKEMHIEGLQWHEGFLKGVIDLIFYHNGFYYLVDWKTNWLGPDLNSYNQENIKNTMLKHDYFFQAHIYREALKRYLKLVDTRPFEEIYGGCLYIFLRGLPLSSAIFKI